MSSLLWKMLLGAGGGAAALGLKTNLVAWWELNEASGTRADSHTNGLHLTDNNTVTSNPGVGGSGTAAQFTAANNESLTRADGALVSISDLDYTYAAWAYGDTLSGNPWIISKADASLEEVRLDYFSNRFRFEIRSGSYVTLTANTLGAPSTGTWYFIVVWHDSVANTINIQVNNGTADSLTTGAVTPADSTGALTIGGAAGSYWDGRIAKVGFWKSAAGAGGVLSAAQRTALYNAGAGLSYAQLT